MKVSQDCQRFLESRKSLVLSTLSELGELETSVMPFVTLDDGELAVCVSELSAHTQNLFYITRPEQEKSASNSTGLVSGLLLADESTTPEMFARERISLQLQVSCVLSPSSERERILDRFSASFGEVVGVLRGLPDFHCFKLRIIRGRYIQGFGSAHAFEGCPCQDMRSINGR